MTIAPTSEGHAPTAYGVLTIAGAAGALACLAALHVLSPEFAAGQRMVSEYALGANGWLLTLMFALWAVSSWTLAAALWPHVHTLGGKVGLVFLIVAGVGEAMAAVFDIQHPLHGVSAMLGVPSLPIAALLVSRSLAREPGWAARSAALKGTAHLTWLSFGLMAAAMAAMIATLGADGEPRPETIQVQGWANRLLVVAYCGWAIVAGMAVLGRGRG